MYKTIDYANKDSYNSDYEIDLYGKCYHIVNIKKATWVLATDKGKVVKVATSEPKILKAAARLEERRAKGNKNGFKFGTKIDETTIQRYAKVAWRKVFTISNVTFDGHYWWMDIEHTKTKEKAEHLRADYFLNYMRAPEGMENYPNVQKRKMAS